MSETILVRGARQLLTLRNSTNEPRRGPALSELGIINDGALLIKDGIIDEVGTSRRVENLAAARDAREIDATGRVVIPGFVDCHTHLVHGLPWLKDYEARIARAPAPEEGLRSSIQLMHTDSARRLEERSRQFVDAMARHGTTTLEAKSGYGLDDTGELKILRVLASLDKHPLDVVPTFLAAPLLPKDQRGDLSEYIYWVCTELLPKIQRRRLARFADIVFDDEGFDSEQARQYLSIARGLGFELKVHCDHFTRAGGVLMGVEMGAISVDHLVCAEPEDISAIARSRTIAVLLPGAEFHTGSQRYAPARQLIDAGAAVALGTDFNPSTSPTYSLQMVVSLACGRMGMTPAEAITAATINSAYAIGYGDRVGSLEVNKQADLLMLDAADYREILYYFGTNRVFLTLKRGAVIYKQGEIRPGTEVLP